MVITNIHQVTLNPVEEPILVRMYEDKLKGGWVKVAEDTSHVTYEIRRSYIVPSSTIYEEVNADANT